MVITSASHAEGLQFEPGCWYDREETTRSVTAYEQAAGDSQLAGAVIGAAAAEQEALRQVLLVWRRAKQGHFWPVHGKYRCPWSDPVLLEGGHRPFLVAVLLRLLRLLVLASDALLQPFFNLVFWLKRPRTPHRGSVAPDPHLSPHGTWSAATERPRRWAHTRHTTAHWCSRIRHHTTTCALRREQSHTTGTLFTPNPKPKPPNPKPRARGLRPLVDTSRTCPACKCYFKTPRPMPQPASPPESVSKGGV